jgi:hypothetical protein
MSTSKNDITGDSLTSRTATQQYRDNYDRIFGNRKIKNSGVFGVFTPNVEEDGTVKTSSLREWLDKNPGPSFVSTEGSSVTSVTPDNTTPVLTRDFNLGLYKNHTVIEDKVSVKSDVGSVFDVPSYFLHYSDRDIPLVYTGPLLDCPIITVENYCKWYSPYVIMSDGVIRKITSEEICQATDEYSNAWHIDHCFHPKLLLKLAEMLNGEACEQSIEMAAGRWVMEQMDDPFDFYPEAKELSDSNDLSVFMKDESPDSETYSFKKMLAENSPPPFINSDQ